MPIGEIVGEVLGGTIRLIGQFISGVVVELLIRRVGYVIWHCVSPRTDPDDWPSVVVGFLFWGILCGLGYLLWPHIMGT